MTKNNEIRLDPQLTIYEVKELYQAIAKKLQVQDDLRLDFSEVTEIDSAGLQLCLLLKKEVDRRHGELEFRALPECVLNFFELFNVSEYLLGATHHS